MTPINLEDVESYIIEQLDKERETPNRTEQKHWLRTRFAELRARKHAKENAEAVAEAEYKLLKKNPVDYTDAFYEKFVREF